MIKTEELDKDYSKNQPRKQIPLSLGRTAAAMFYLFYQHLLGWKAAKQHTIHFKVRCFKAGWNESLNLLRRDELEQQTVCSSVHQNETSDHKEILVSDADTKLPRNLRSTIKKKTLNPKKIFSCFNHIFKIFSPHLAPFALAFNFCSKWNRSHMDNILLLHAVLIPPQSTAILILPAEWGIGEQ